MSSRQRCPYVTEVCKWKMSSKRACHVFLLKHSLCQVCSTSVVFFPDWSHVSGNVSCCLIILVQVVTYEGFYDDQLEWVGLEGVQLVASMNPGSSMGRHLLTTRFTSIVRIACIK